MNLISELKRRNVFRVAAAYLVVGWLLTEVLTTILPTLGAPGWVVTAVILVFALGFIPTVILSWVYQLTPDGIRKEKDAESEDSGSVEAASKGDYATIAVIVLAIVIIAFFSASRGPEEASPTMAAVGANSVAVLPFVNMSRDEDNEYFSDGLTETLLHMLVQVPDLKVAARTSSFAFKGKNMDIREIAEALQVAHILEGSVQQAGNRVRITAQLIRAEDGFHVWSETFDRTNEDIFAIQDEIAVKVGGALSASLLGTGEESMLTSVETTNPDAYDLYLQALREGASNSYGGLQASEQLLKGALSIDPDFLDAKTALAGNYLHQYETGLMDGNDAFAAVLAISDQVLDVQPDDAATRAIRLFAEAAPYAREGSPEAIFDTIRELEQIVAENPDEYQARVLLSRLLQGVRQFDRALKLQQEALQRDPYNARILFEIGSLHLELKQYDEAREALQKSLDIEPGQPNAYMRLGLAALHSGDGVEFVRMFLEALKVDPRDYEIPGVISAFLYQLGLPEEADNFRNRVLAIAPTSEIAYRIELLRAISIGDEVSALAAARRAIEDDIDERQFAYGGAVQYLLRIAARDGTVANETAYLEQHAPGILDVDATQIPNKYRLAQLVAFDAWYTTLSREELGQRFERIQEIFAAFGLDAVYDPRIQVDVLAMSGDVDQAIAVALSDVFTLPVANNLDWRSKYAQAHFTGFVADARVQAALKKWENEQDALRKSVKAFLLDLSSA